MDIQEIPQAQQLTLDNYQDLSKTTAIFPEVSSELADCSLDAIQVSATIAGYIKKIYRDAKGEISVEKESSIKKAILLAQNELELVKFLVESKIGDNSASSINPKLVYPLLGLADEVGELVEKVMDNDVEGATKELGDVLWYLAQIATGLGVSLATVAADNLKKLFSRKERGVLKGSGDNR
jgi:NTP pyrophosphatase (non-canonical NTP hydrolase)